MLSRDLLEKAKSTVGMQCCMYRHSRLPINLIQGLSLPV